MATILTRDALIAKFEEIEQAYSVFYSAVYPDFIFTPKTYTARDEEALSSLAENLVQAEGARIGILQKERTEKLAELAAAPTLFEAQKAQKIKEANQFENDASLRLSLDAFARNMQKSAFYLSRSAQIYSEAAQKRAEAEAEYSAAMATLSEKEREINTAYDALVTEAEAVYRAALAAKKEELLLAETARAERVLEYNNSMEKEAVEYNLKAVNGVFDRANDDTVTRASMMYEKMAACHDYLSIFTTREALHKVTTDEIYSKYLGSYGSRSLIEYYQAKYDAEQSA